MQIDRLTGLMGLAALKDAIDAKLRLAHEEFELSLLCADVDNMKHFNAHNGHVKGDALRVQIAGIIDNAVACHQLFRTGGDEFISVLDACDLAGAQGIAGQVKAAMENADLISQLDHCGDKHCMGPARIGLSVGLLSVELQIESDADSLIRAVRERMLDAKLLGRSD